MAGFTSHESNANEVLLATGVTVSPIQPVGMSNGGHGTLASAAIAGQVRCLMDLDSRPSRICLDDSRWLDADCACHHKSARSVSWSG